MGEKRIIRADDIVWRRIGDDVVVIRDDGLAVHVLNKTAAHIWERCDGSYRPDEIVASLCERFDVGPEEARADVEQTLNKLAEIGILRFEEAREG